MLYGCETGSLKLRDECWLRVFENRILMQIFEPNRNAYREWGRLHNEELHSLYRSPNKVSAFIYGNVDIVDVNPIRQIHQANIVPNL